jgi:hypothetical protein
MVYNPVSTGTQGSGILGPGEQHGAEGVTGDRGTAGAADSPFANGLNLSNAAVGNYQNLVAAITNLESAYSRLKSTATPIAWEQYGQQAAGAASGFDKLTVSLTGLTGKLEELNSRQTLINSLVRLGSAMPSMVGQASRIMASSQALTKVELVGDAPVKTMLADGWQSRRVVGVGANSHEALQLYKSIQTRMVRAYNSGINTVDPRTLDYRMRQLEKLNKDMDNLQALVLENRKNEVSGRPMTAEELKIFDINNEDGNFARLQTDIHGSIGSLQRRSLKLGTEPKAQKLSSHIGALSARLEEFRDNRDYRTLDDAAKWYKRASAMLEDDKPSMTNADYTRYRSRLNVYASTLDTLRAEGKIDPKFAVKQIGGSLNALNAEMGLLRSGGISEDQVRARLEKAQAMMEQYAPWVDNENKVAQLQAGLHARQLELDGFGKSSAALKAFGALQRGQLLGVKPDQADIERVRAALRGEIATHDEILKDDKTSVAAKKDSETQVHKLNAAMRQLDSIAKGADKSFASLFNHVAGVAGMVVGIYSLRDAFAQMAQRAIEFDSALRRVDVALQRITDSKERNKLGNAIKTNAIQDALSYGMDINQTAQLYTTAVMGSKGDERERVRLGRTMSQLAFSTPTQAEEYASMVAPLTNAGLDASMIDRFFQSSQVMQGQLNLTPERFRVALSSIATNSAGVDVLTDWETAQAIGWHEAAATKDRVRGSKLSRLQMAFRNPKNLLKMQNILSRSGSRESIGGMDISEIVNDTNPMLSIDRISKLYRSGEINSQELNAVAQTVDMWSSPSTMNLFKNGLDDWRSRVRMSNALGEVGHVSTDKMADKQAESIHASINRIQQSLGNLATSGLDPFGRAVRTVANLMEATGGKLASLLNGLGSIAVAGVLGIGTTRGVQTISKAVKDADGWGNLLGGKKVVENGVQVSGGWRSALTGGLVGLGITGALMGASYAYDYYREQREAKINDHNEKSAGSLLMMQREYDQQQQLLNYAQDIRTAAANGTLTAERQRDITKEINKLLVERGKGEALVREIMHGQTTELEKQMDLLKGRTAYNEQATLVTALTNYTEAYGSVGGLGKDATAAVNVQRLLIRARDLVSSGAAMPELEKLMTTHFSGSVMGIGPHKGHTLMELAGRLDPNNPLGGYDYNVLEKRDSGLHLAPQDGSPVSVHYILRVLDDANLLKDPSLLAAEEIHGGGEIGKDKKSALELAGKQAGRVSALGMEARADNRRAQVGKDYISWFNKNHEGFYKEVAELYNNPMMTLSTLTESIDKQFGGGVGEALAKKGGPLALQPLLDRITADKDLLGGVAKTNISTNDGAGIAEYYFNNRFSMKNLPESSRRLLADYLLATRAGSMGSAPSNMNLGGGARMPKMLADLYLKAHNDKRTAISLASTPWLSELQGMFDTKQGFKIEGKFMSVDAMEKEDLDPKTGRLAKWYNQQLSKVLPGGREALDENYREEREKLKERYRNIRAIHGMLPSLVRQENRDMHSRIVENLTAMDKDYYADKYSEYLSSPDAGVAQFAGIMMDYQIAASKEAKAKLPEALAAFGGDKEQERIAGRYYTAAKQNILIKAKAASYAQHVALSDWERFVSDAQKPALSLFAGERETNASITNEINKQLQSNQELYKDEHATLTDRLNIMRQSVALEKQKVELDMQVIRARKAAAVGMEAQGQLVDILTDVSGAGTLNRTNNLRNIGMSLVNRGLGDSVRRALGDMDNPLAKMASFIYDPTGSMDVKYAQERLTNATLSLADRIDELTATLRENSKTIDGLYNNGLAEAGGSAGGPSTTAAKAALSVVAPGKGAAARSASSAASPASAISSSLPGGSFASLASIFGGKGDISAAFNSNPDRVTNELLNIGIKPTNGTKFTAEELVKRKDEIARKQAVAQQSARNNPFSGIFGGGASFGASFYEVGGRGRGGIVVDSAGNAVLDAHGNNTYGGWGATQNQYDANGNLTKQGQGGLSTTGAVVGSAQALMAGYTAWQANRDNGAGARDKAAAGSTLMAAGSTVAMIPGAGVVGGVMMGVGAILNIMAGADASEHAAKKKDEAFQKQLDELQRTIAIQEEQKKAIGLMAERVLSMRGDVGNTFEGIASSAFLSGRWAGRAIQVQHLTVVANNPTELSQALTTALTTQSRQGA